MRGKRKANKTLSIKECLVELGLSIRESVICFDNKENISSILLYYFPKHLHLEDLISLASLPDVSYSFYSRDG